MRINCLLMIAGAVASQSAAAETVRAETCRKGEDVRVIEVVVPGTVGTACDVVYTRDGGGNVAVPYNANVDKDFCRARAAELAGKLAVDGFDCAVGASDTLEAALAGGEARTAEAVTDAPLDVQLHSPAGTQDQSPADDAADEIAAAQSVEPQSVEPQSAKSRLEPLIQPRAVAAAENTAPDPPAPAAPARQSENAIPAGPIQLAADARPSAYRAPKPPPATGPGRLVGAQPSIEDIIDVSTPPTIDPAKVAAATKAGIPARAGDEVIRRILAANAAAWNEGNLDAFMGGYVTGADLILIKNAVVTTGWRDVKKAYEADIAANAGMGRLAFENLEVSMTSQDVATVVGRYVLTQGDAVSAGVITLVMKSNDGQWRIVQETRVATAQPTQ